MEGSGHGPGFSLSRPWQEQAGSQSKPIEERRGGVVHVPVSLWNFSLGLVDSSRLCCSEACRSVSFHGTFFSFLFLEEPLVRMTHTVGKRFPPAHNAFHVHVLNTSLHDNQCQSLEFSSGKGSDWLALESNTAHWNVMLLWNSGGNILI